MKITKTELKTYTVNATPERYDVSQEVNAANHKEFATIVSNTLAARDIDGFTIQEVNGYWQGTPEKSYIITVATDATSDKIEAVCDSLRHRYDQDAVMLTYPDGRVALQRHNKKHKQNIQELVRLAGLTFSFTSIIMIFCDIKYF